MPISSNILVKGKYPMHLSLNASLHFSSSLMETVSGATSSVIFLATSLKWTIAIHFLCILRNRFDLFGWNSANDSMRRDIFRNDCPRRNDRTISNCHTITNCHISTNPDILTNFNRFGEHIPAFGHA